MNPDTPRLWARYLLSVAPVRGDGPISVNEHARSSNYALDAGGGTSVQLSSLKLQCETTPIQHTTPSTHHGKVMCR